MKTRTKIVATTLGLAAITSAAVACVVDETNDPLWCGEKYGASIFHAQYYDGQTWVFIDEPNTLATSCLTAYEHWLMVEKPGVFDLGYVDYQNLVAALELSAADACDAWADDEGHPQNDCYDPQHGTAEHNLQHPGSCDKPDTEANAETCKEYYDCDEYLDESTDTSASNCHPDGHPYTQGEGSDGYDNLSTLISCTGGTVPTCTIDEDVVGQFWHSDAMYEDGSRLKQHKDATGAPDGWEVIGCDTDNLCDELGFEDGDIIIEVDDISIKDPTEATAAWMTLMFEVTITVDYTRGRENKSVNLEFL